MVCSWAGSCPLSVGVLSRSSLTPSGREGSDTGQPVWSGRHWPLTPAGLSQQQAAVRQGDLHLQEDGGGVSATCPPPPPSGARGREEGAGGQPGPSLQHLLPPPAHSYYKGIRQMVQVSDQDMNTHLAEISRVRGMC